MSFILGIDTGGTYTDGVIVDSEAREVLAKAKVLTTRDNLVIGIDECISALGFERQDEIIQVSISTTLATNSIVEGKGSTVGLLYMGEELEDNVPAKICRKVAGKLDIRGNVTEPVDTDEVKAVLESMKGQIEALAVSGYASVRNPDQELAIMELAGEILNVPVVCGHQLTSALGFQQRTITAVLNSKLIPVINDLLISIDTVMAKHHISAPVMVVKGDGSLMTVDMARTRPVETILSGPAASVSGGMTMAGFDDCLVIDMGGTTTDIANVTGGTVNIKKEGAKVGGWLTRVQAADISTFGIGGDSRIYLESNGVLNIGPEKVMPLSLAGCKYPHLTHELRSFKRVGELKSYFPHEADCYYYKDDAGLPEELTPIESRVLEKLKERPHSISYLASTAGRDPEVVDLSRLLAAGVIGRITLTPTDLLHITGEYAPWNRDLPASGLGVLAARLDISPAEFLDKVMKSIDKKLMTCILQSCADFEAQPVSLESSAELSYMIDRSVGLSQSSLLKPEFEIKKPIIAIGAPASVWLKNIDRRLKATVVVPEHADVANAYGAASGQIIQSTDMLITYDEGKYILNSAWSRNEYVSMEEALFYAVHEGRKHLEHIMMAAGCSRWHIEEERQDMYHIDSFTEQREYTGSKLHIRAVSDPDRVGANS